MVALAAQSMAAIAAWTDHDLKVYQCSSHMALRFGPTISPNLCVSVTTQPWWRLILKKEGLTSNVGRAMPRQAVGHESRNQHLSACNHLRSKLRPLTLLSRTLTSWTYCYHLCRDYATLFLVTPHFTMLPEGSLVGLKRGLPIHKAMVRCTSSPID